MSTVTVRIENAYTDGHESEVDVELEAPEDPAELGEWWDDVVFPHTGDGHGAEKPGLGSYHIARIDRADDESLVGQSMEWSD